MLIKKSFLTEEGMMTFEGEMTPQEVDVVMTVGIATLLHKGAMPHIQEDGTIRVDRMEELH